MPIIRVCVYIHTPWIHISAEFLTVKLSEFTSRTRPEQKFGFSLADRVTFHVDGGTKSQALWSAVFSIYWLYKPREM